MVRFAARIEKPLATASLINTDGLSIPLLGLIDGDSHYAPDGLVIPLPGLGPGNYFFLYKVFSRVGQATSSTLHFSLVGYS